MSKHRADDVDQPILGARVLTDHHPRDGYRTDDIAVLVVQKNYQTGGVEVWADEIDPRTGVTSRTLVNIRFANDDDALAFAEAIVREAGR